MGTDSDRDILLISVFTFFTVSLWISFELLKTIKTTTIQESTKEIIVPFSPEIDTDTLVQIDNRRVY